MWFSSNQSKIDKMICERFVFIEQLLLIVALANFLLSEQRSCTHSLSANIYIICTTMGRVPKSPKTQKPDPRFFLPTLPEPKKIIANPNWPEPEKFKPITIWVSLFLSHDILYLNYYVQFHTKLPCLNGR